MSILRNKLKEMMFNNEVKREKEKQNVVIDTDSVQYKTLVKRLEKFDNPMTDAVRMALLYLEDKGKSVDIKQFEEYIKTK